MNDQLVESIRDKLRAKSDEELVEMWVENNRGEWSDEAFEAIRRILSERLKGPLPQQQAYCQAAHVGEEGAIASKPTWSGLFSFRGRIGRSGFWAIGWLIPGIIAGLIASSQRVPIISLLSLLSIPFVLWLMIATHVKRWHGRDKSGWMALTLLIPFLGPVWSIVELGFLRGTAGPNRYGKDPIASKT